MKSLVSVIDTGLFLFDQSLQKGDFVKVEKDFYT